MGLTSLPDPTEAQYQTMDRIAAADDRDWEGRRRVKGIEMRGYDYVAIVMVTANGREQTIAPNGRVGTRGPRGR